MRWLKTLNEVIVLMSCSYKIFQQVVIGEFAATNSEILAFDNWLVTCFFAFYVSGPIKTGPDPNNSCFSFLRVEAVRSDALAGVSTVANGVERLFHLGKERPPLGEGKGGVC